MAKESSKLLLFKFLILLAVLQKGFGEGGTTLEHAARRINGIIRDRLDGDPSLTRQGHQDPTPRPEPDPLSKFRWDHHLPLRRRFHHGHPRSPRFWLVEHIYKKFNSERYGSQDRLTLH